MLPRLAHRGPDDEGLWSRHNVALGHRRLSIVDLSAAGHQPMVSAEGSLASVVNGEIYNYPDLRAELERTGASFRSHSDSEVVLHAYRAYGTAAFAKLNGMFAFAIYDVERGRLFLVRDRLGIKPVYYWYDPETRHLLFASEIKAILAAANRSRWSIDPEGLSQYLSCENLLGDRSLFRDIHCLGPGSFLDVGRDGLRIETYWSPSFATMAPGMSYTEASRRFDTTFGAAVGRHLMGDVSVASYVSSGFDSTLVAAEAARRLSDPPHAFTGTFDKGGWYDEGSGARIVARHIGSPITEVTIHADAFASEMDHVVLALDEPRMGTGAFSQYMVAKAAAREFKVILTGHGGDELFSGYPVFKNAALVDAGNIGDAFATLASMRPAELPHIAYFTARRLFPGGASGELPVLFDAARKRGALRPLVHDAIAGCRSTGPLEDILCSARSAYERVLLTYLRAYLPGLLVVEDKISMAHSLESRTPFLDNEMVEFSLTIPPQVKLEGGSLKALIKEAAKQRLPAELFQLPKRGFPTPLSHWLRGPLNDWLRRRLTGPESRLGRLFETQYVAGEVERYLGSWRRNVRPLDELPTHRMWMLLSLESWLRQAEEKYGVTLEL
jgi:asparagine synthase (glutamine-hydrolysing)